MANAYKGINTGAELDKAKKAIKDYVAELERYLNGLKSPDVTSAFVGDYSVAAKNFIGNVIDGVKESLDDLKAFDLKIETYKKQYQAEDARMTSNINNVEVPPSMHVK